MDEEESWIEYRVLDVSGDVPRQVHKGPLTSLDYALALADNHAWPCVVEESRCSRAAWQPLSAS